MPPPRLATPWRRPCLEDVFQADQVVSDHVQAEHPAEFSLARAARASGTIGLWPRQELAQPASLFEPANNLLDATSGIDRLGIAHVAGGAAINR